MDKNYAENRKKEQAHYTTTSISQQQQQKRNKLPTCTLVSQHQPRWSDVGKKIKVKYNNNEKKIYQVRT